MSFGGHLWNIKFSKTVRQAYDYISYLKSPMKSDNNCIIVVYIAQISLKKRIFQARPACTKQTRWSYQSVIGSFTQKAGLCSIEWPY